MVAVVNQPAVPTVPALPAMLAMVARLRRATAELRPTALAARRVPVLFPLMSVHVVKRLTQHHREPPPNAEVGRLSITSVAANTAALTIRQKIALSVLELHSV